jgi:hypothetical protein
MGNHSPLTNGFSRILEDLGSGKADTEFNCYPQSPHQLTLEVESDVWCSRCYVPDMDDNCWISRHRGSGGGWPDFLGNNLDALYL